MGPSVRRLLELARELQRATTLPEVIACARREVERGLGYSHAWLFVADKEPIETIRLVDVSGPLSAQSFEAAAVIDATADAMVAEIIRSEAPVVVEDARTDPRTDKVIVEKLGNRTIINIPIRLVDKPFGGFGVGTFGDEGVRPPTEAELEYLIGMTGQLAIAIGRIRLNEERSRRVDEQRALDARLAELQKLESLGLLAGGVAHDFNNLLTVILTSAALLKDGPARTSDELDAILAAAQRGHQLTKQLLAMARRTPMLRRPLDVNERVREVVALLRRVLPETIEIDVIAGRSLPSIEADPSQLDQVLMNLGINARDAMQSGGRLTIETEQVVINGPYVREHPWAKSGRYVLIAITDTGVGMTEDVRQRLFEPFFTTKGQAGTGLGLAVSYGIVRQHDGMLHCYSEPGVGTTFKIYLPVLARDAATVGTKLSRPAPGGVERVLVAEDDRAVQSAVRRVLERAGYHVTIVGDGEEACRAAAQSAFDLIVLDVVMPRLGGTEALERIRATLPNARFLLSSGYLGDPAALALLEAGAAKLVAKPYGPDELLQAVREALDG